VLKTPARGTGRARRDELDAGGSVVQTAPITYELINLATDV
jgi:hypothetical protein